MRKARIAIIGGDGIGPEVVDAALPVIEAAARTEGLTLDIHADRTGFKKTLPERNAVAVVPPTPRVQPVNVVAVVPV